MVEEQEKKTGMAFVSPVSTAPTSNTVERTADDSRAHPSTQVCEVRETGIDDDLGEGRYNPFNNLAKPVVDTNAAADADAEGKLKKKKKGKKKKKKEKRVKGTPEEEEERKRRRKERKERKRLEKLKQEDASGVPSTIQTVTEEKKPEIEVTPAKAEIAEKPEKKKRTRPVRKPLPVAQSSAKYRRELAAKAEVERLQTEAGASASEGVAFLPAYVSHRCMYSAFAYTLLMCGKYCYCAFITLHCCRHVSGCQRW